MPQDSLNSKRGHQSSRNVDDHKYEQPELSKSKKRPRRSKVVDDGDYEESPPTSDEDGYPTVINVKSTSSDRRAAKRGKKSASTKKEKKPAKRATEKDAKKRDTELPGNLNKPVFQLKTRIKKKNETGALILQKPTPRVVRPTTERPELIRHPTSAEAIAPAPKLQTPEDTVVWMRSVPEAICSQVTTPSVKLSMIRALITAAQTERLRLGVLKLMGDGRLIGKAIINTTDPTIFQTLLKLLFTLHPSSADIDASADIFSQEGYPPSTGFLKQAYRLAPESRNIAIHNFFRQHRLGPYTNTSTKSGLAGAAAPSPSTIAPVPIAPTASHSKIPPAGIAPSTIAPVPIAPTASHSNIPPAGIVPAPSTIAPVPIAPTASHSKIPPAGIAPAPSSSTISIAPAVPSVAVPAQSLPSHDQVQGQEESWPDAPTLVEPVEANMDETNWLDESELTIFVSLGERGLMIDENAFTDARKEFLAEERDEDMAQDLDVALDVEDDELLDETPNIKIQSFHGFFLPEATRFALEFEKEWGTGNGASYPSDSEDSSEYCSSIVCQERESLLDDLSSLHFDDDDVPMEERWIPLTKRKEERAHKYPEKRSKLDVEHGSGMLH